MFEVDIKVNGVIISRIIGNNLLRPSIEYEGLYDESCEYSYLVEEYTIDKVVGTSLRQIDNRVLHKRKEGICKLIYIILGDYLKNVKKLENELKNK
jgi:hypothetical protein